MVVKLQEADKARSSAAFHDLEPDEAFFEEACRRLQAYNDMKHAWKEFTKQREVAEWVCNKKIEVARERLADNLTDILCARIPYLNQLHDIMGQWSSSSEGSGSSKGEKVWVHDSASNMYYPGLLTKVRHDAEDVFSGTGIVTFPDVGKQEYQRKEVSWSQGNLNYWDMSDGQVFNHRVPPPQVRQLAIFHRTITNPIHMDVGRSAAVREFERY